MLTGFSFECCDHEKDEILETHSFLPSFQSAIVNALFPEHRRGNTGIFNIMLDLEGLGTLIAMVRGYLVPITAAAQALHDTQFGAAVQKADWEYSRIESWIRSQ